MLHHALIFVLLVLCTFSLSTGFARVNMADLKTICMTNNSPFLHLVLMEYSKSECKQKKTVLLS